MRLSSSVTAAPNVSSWYSTAAVTLPSKRTDVKPETSNSLVTARPDAVTRSPLSSSEVDEHPDARTAARTVTISSTHSAMTTARLRVCFTATSCDTTDGTPGW